MPSSQIRFYLSFRHFALAGWCGLVIAGIAGCDGPEVKKYTAPREKVAPDMTRLESYALPNGWARMAKPVELSVASFQVGGGDKPIVVTINRFPGHGGGLALNVGRWRKKIGLPPINDEEVAKEALSLKVDGEKTPYVDIANPEKKDANRILGVVADRGAVTWFFVMQGPPEQVDKHKTDFEKFVESVKFGATGAS